MSKGSNRRPLDEEHCNEKQFEDNWEKIFGKKSAKTLWSAGDKVPNETEVQEKPEEEI